MEQEFKEHLKKFNTNPYLFIGSGISRRYIGLPTWQSLLELFFKHSKIKKDFEYYVSLCGHKMPKLSSLLAAEFHEIWWNDPHFEASRKINKSIAGEGIQLPYKIELIKFLESKVIGHSKEYSDEINLLGKCVIDGIITTNWDTFLERIFPDYEVYIGQQELLFSNSSSYAEIYKIHGCVTDPSSIIISEEDYNGFKDKSTYLAAKLLTIFVEHPIVFMGYSLSDGNIIDILNSIVKCVDSKNIDKLKDRLIFVEWSSGPSSFTDGTIMLPDNRVLPIKLIRADSFEPIYEVLVSLKKRLPVKILRKLKETVVEFVQTNEPNSKIFVKDFDSIDKNSDIEYAIGVGVATQLISAHGYIGVEAANIFEDILYDNRNYDSKLLIDIVFPKLLKGNVYIPIYKYLKKEGFLTKGAQLNGKGEAYLQGKFTIRSNIPDCLMPIASYKKKQVETRKVYKDVNSIIKAYDKIHAIQYLPLLEKKQIDLDDLLAFLKECFVAPNFKIDTAFKKLVCLYDYYKHGFE